MNCGDAVEIVQVVVLLLVASTARSGLYRNDFLIWHPDRAGATAFLGRELEVGHRQLKIS
jgi:hypothetical protein